VLSGTYNVTLTRVRATFVALEKQLHSMHMHMRHIVVCGLHRSAILFPHFLINGTIFEKKKFLTQSVF
jgi:hypothetical protein